jgi:ATP-dependent Clp protease ATP-binding subunit ClpB
MDLNKFTIRSQQAIQQAQTITTGLGQQQIETGHLLKGLLEVDKDVTPFLLKKLNVNTATLLAALDRIVNGYPKVRAADRGSEPPKCDGVEQGAGRR